MSDDDEPPRTAAHWDHCTFQNRRKPPHEPPHGLGRALKPPTGELLDPELKEAMRALDASTRELERVRLWFVLSTVLGILVILTGLASMWFAFGGTCP